MMSKNIQESPEFILKRPSKIISMIFDQIGSQLKRRTGTSGTTISRKNYGQFLKISKKKETNTNMNQGSWVMAKEMGKDESLIRLKTPCSTAVPEQKEDVNTYVDV